MFFFPIVIYLFEAIQMFYRATLQNKIYSITSIINAISIAFLSVVGAYYLQVVGVVIFRYLAIIISIVIGIILLDRKYLVLKAKDLSKELIKPFVKFSLISSFNTAISQLLYIIDIFLIGLIIQDERIVATYKVATVIPFALNFIPVSVTKFIYPYFAKNNKNKTWIYINYKKLLKYLIPINFVISMLLYILAPFIIKLIFGSQYSDALVPFRILSVGYFIAASFRIPAGNVLVMIKKIKFTMYLSLLTGILNILADIYLIRSMGSNGAAISTVSVFLFTSVIVNIYIFRELKKKES